MRRAGWESGKLSPVLYRHNRLVHPDNFPVLRFTSVIEDSIRILIDFAVRIRRELSVAEHPAQRRQEIGLNPKRSNMRVLQFAPRVCWPLDTGAKLRNYHLARVLAERAHVTLLAFDDGPEPLNNFENSYQKVITVKRGQGYTPTKILRGALGRVPLPLLNYTSETMKHTLSQTLNDQEFDVVQVESIHLMGYLPIIRRRPNPPSVICDWHNIESELMHRYSEREPNLLRRTYARNTARQLRAVERQAMFDFQAHVVVSQRDRERLLKLNNNSSVSVIENGVDSAYYSDEELKKAHLSWRIGQNLGNGGLDNGMAASRPNRIVFVGSMDYHANIDGVVEFARKVWPAVVERNPELVFTIVGRDPTAEVRQLATIRGVEVTGTVADVRPYYSQSLASIVPLAVGGGSRLKILESIAAGVPVVSTTLGAEGLEVRHAENILIADTKAQLLDAITAVVENEQLRRQLRDSGRALVASRYDWNRLGANLFELFTSLVK